MASASDKVKQYCVAAVNEYITIRQRRRIVEICGERAAEIENTMGRWFIGYVGAWSKNDILMAIARAFDRTPRTASVRHGLTYLEKEFRSVARAGCWPGGIDACLNRYEISAPEDVAPKIAAVARHLKKRLSEIEPALAAVDERRNKLLAHRSLAGPEGDLVWADITCAQGFLLRYIDCLQPMFDGGGALYTGDGELTVTGIEQPWTSFETLLDTLGKDRAGFMPEGYRLDNYGARCWRVFSPDGLQFGEGNDPEESLALAWLHSVGRYDPMP